MSGHGIHSLLHPSKVDGFTSYLTAHGFHVEEPPPQAEWEAFRVYWPGTSKRPMVFFRNIRRDGCLTVPSDAYALVRSYIGPPRSRRGRPVPAQKPMSQIIAEQAALMASREAAAQPVAANAGVSGYSKGLPVPFVYERIFAYTDGGCDNKDGSGGWGLIMRFNTHEAEFYGGMPGQTNNTMELTAILAAFRHRKNPDVPMTIVSDSQYALGCLTLWWPNWKRNNWRKADKKPVLNRELIEEILGMIKPHDAFHWVKGHAGHDYNERVDKLASKGRREFGYAEA